MSTIEQLSAIEILDSRGRPTVQAHCVLQGGAEGSASVPSGASTGSAEAIELRDGDSRRYRGLGCRQAVANVNGPIREALAGRRNESQQTLDRALCELDGSDDKSRLGANAILATSLAYARAAARARGQSLYVYFAALAGRNAERLPCPTINLFSGGLHAGGQVPIQDVLIVPAAASMDQALAQSAEVYQCAVELCAEKYSMRHLTADEGGLAPAVGSSRELLDDALRVIERAGLTPGDDMFLALDVAATHFFRQGSYAFEGSRLDGAGMTEVLLRWLDNYPIVSLEDGLAEDDWQHWPELRAAASGRAIILGDDFLCTNPARIERAVAAGAADALLLKVNQIGTLSEALESHRLASAADWAVTVSARSGETEDDWLADLAVGWSGDYIKIGSLNQSERLAKYNRLLAIEATTGFELASPIAA